MNCESCVRGFINTRDKISCGAYVDDGALRGDPGLNPIWAERKYGEATIIGLLVGRPLPEGTDCDNLDPSDGADCKIWKAKT